MEGGGRWFVPVARSTPINVRTGPGLEHNTSNVSVRSRQKRTRRPQRRTESGTDVLFIASRHPAPIRDVQAVNQSNSGNANNERRKKQKNRGRLLAAEIRYLQRTTHLLVRRASFARVVRSLARRMDFEAALEIRWQSVALDCLQEAAEAFMVDFFSFAARAAAHAHRVTVMLADIQFISQFYHMLR